MSESLSWTLTHQSNLGSNGDNFGLKSSSYTKRGDEATKLQRRWKSTPEESAPPPVMETPAQWFERLIDPYTKQKPVQRWSPAPSWSLQKAAGFQSKAVIISLPQVAPLPVSAREREGSSPAASAEHESQKVWLFSASFMLHLSQKLNYCVSGAETIC